MRGDLESRLCGIAAPHFQSGALPQLFRSALLLACTHVIADRIQTPLIGNFKYLWLVVNVQLPSKNGRRAHLTKGPTAHFHLLTISRQ